MGDFASTLVLAMIRRALAVQGLGFVLGRAAPQTGSGASGARIVPIGEKQALLADVLGRHGPIAILRVADVVGDFADHPVAVVFAGARTAGQVIDSWLAIERYFHSRHRTRIVALEAGQAVMQHVDTRGGAISQAEDLAVAGLILGILRWRGATGARLWLGGQMVFDDDFVAAAGPIESTAQWKVEWGGFEPVPTHPCMSLTLPRVDHAGRSLEDAVVAGLFAERVKFPHLRCGVAAHATRLAMSVRTLQRRLGQTGWTPSDIVASARIHVATRLLAQTDTPLSLVGLLAGYSDQPHFQREFRKCVGPTPAGYRSLAG